MSYTVALRRKLRSPIDVSHGNMMQRSVSSAYVIAVAGVIGIGVGLASVALTPAGQIALQNGTNELAAAHGLTRRREPAAGDHWGGCNDARAAGTAPIYRGKPGYRPKMDGDGGGIACEPHQVAD